jgi:hypothetical protein
MTDLELTIVATRRPDLLAATMESFQAKLLKNFKISRVSINIDPLWGDNQDEAQCCEIMRRYYPECVIYTPEQPGYAAAVQRLWSNTSADFIFHLEDDWNLAEDIQDDIFSIFNDPLVMEVSLMCKEKNWDVKKRGPYHFAKIKHRILGIPLPFYGKFPSFTVSPSFLRGDFARHWAGLMDSTRDPEKQARPKQNSKLATYVAPFRNYIYSGKTVYNIAIDIGRTWRDKKNIKKTIVDGESLWSRPTPD